MDVSIEAQAAAMASMIVGCSLGGPNGRPNSVILILGEGDGGTTTVGAEVASVASAIAKHFHEFAGPHGVVNFCLSCVLTRGTEQVAADVGLDGGSLPLVYGPHSLCTTELVNLLLCGVARGNISAYENDGRRVEWRAKLRSPIAGLVGILSSDEQSGRSLADELKSPAQPVWILHGGDHFTIFWSTSRPQQAEPQQETKINCFHWNGLPPHRRMTQVQVQNATLAPLEPSPPLYTQTEWKMVVGQVESIVQANPEDKKTRLGAWRLHRYEIALANEALVAEDASDPRPANLPPPVTFELGIPPGPGEQWRCLSCYQTRFKTMCFGQNPCIPSSGNEAVVCKFCGLNLQQAGWTIQRHYEDMPASMQRRVDRMAGPKILTVLRTRWPAASPLLLNSTKEWIPLGATNLEDVNVPMT